MPTQILAQCMVPGHGWYDIAYHASCPVCAAEQTRDAQEVSEKDLCPVCNGKGGMNIRSVWTTCSYCRGTGLKT